MKKPWRPSHIMENSDGQRHKRRLQDLTFALRISAGKRKVIEEGMIDSNYDSLDDSIVFFL